MTPRGTDPRIGSLADEAGQLIDAVTARLVQFRSDVAPDPAPDQTTVDPASVDSAPVDPPPVRPPPLRPAPVRPAEPGPRVASAHTCVGWCPVCRGADLLRGDRSEVSEKLVDTALLVLGTLRSLLPEQPPAATADSSPTNDPGERPGVERIDIR